MSTKAFGEHVHVMDHPLVAHKLTIMRDKNTSVKDFRELVSEIGMLITYEATRDLPLTTKTVETPICTAEEPTLAGKKIAVVPLLRAGLGLVDGVLRMVPWLYRPRPRRRRRPDFRHEVSRFLDFPAAPAYNEPVITAISGF